MKYPLVSLVMPTLNSGRYVRETLHSLIDQVHRPLELIVVDGGSTDDTIPILESYLGDGDLTIIKLSREDGSMPKSLNAGIAAAKGEFIARMDADDIAYKWRLNDQVYHLITHPEVALIGTGVDIFGAREGTHRSPFTHREIRDMFLINNPFFHPTVMFRRELYDNGLFYYDERQVTDEDYELWGRLIPKVTCANLDQASIRYRVHQNNAQWDPRKHDSKERALQGFCQGFGIADKALIDALVEFQCGSFMRRATYEALHDYAERAEKQALPKLGWIHEAMLRESSFGDFVAWFRKAKGWAL